MALATEREFIYHGWDPVHQAKLLVKGCPDGDSVSFHLAA